jgi:hypothetical protein
VPSFSIFSLVSRFLANFFYNSFYKRVSVIYSPATSPANGWTGRFFSISFPFYCSYLLCPRSPPDLFSLSFVRLFFCGEARGDHSANCGRRKGSGAEDGLGLCFRFPKKILSFLGEARTQVVRYRSFIGNSIYQESFLLLLDLYS